VRNFNCGHPKSNSNSMLRKDGGIVCCRVCKAASNLKWRRKHPEWYVQEQRKLRKQRLDPLLKAQRSCCAICKRFMNFPYEDHNHSCCKTNPGCPKCRRGLLCPSCNAALHLFENKKLFKAAIKYLKKWETQWKLKNI
jgi:hypothetical protein